MVDWANPTHHFFAAAGAGAAADADADADADAEADAAAGAAAAATAGSSSEEDSSSSYPGKQSLKVRSACLAARWVSSCDFDCVARKLVCVLVVG
jgi:hypothetical protein